MCLFFFFLCTSYLVLVHSCNEEGEGDGSSCHGMGGRHPILCIRPHFQLDDRWWEGPRPLQDVLRDLAYVHHDLGRGKATRLSVSTGNPHSAHPRTTSISVLLPAKSTTLSAEFIPWIIKGFSIIPDSERSGGFTAPCRNLIRSGAKRRVHWQDASIQDGMRGTAGSHPMLEKFKFPPYPLQPLSCRANTYKRNFSITTFKWLPCPAVSLPAPGSSSPRAAPASPFQAAPTPTTAQSTAGTPARHTIRVVVR